MPPHQVLVVDDDAENCRVLSELLTLEGFEVCSFESGQEAWAAIQGRTVRPRIVVADVRMPGLDGLGLLRRIKQDSASISVVLVSAFPDDAVWTEGLKAGAADVFPKPIRSGALIRTLLTLAGGIGGDSPGGEEQLDSRTTGVPSERRDT